MTALHILEIRRAGVKFLRHLLDCDEASAQQEFEKAKTTYRFHAQKEHQVFEVTLYKVETTLLSHEYLECEFCDGGK